MSKMSFEDFKKMIKTELDENMSIGIHGVKEETLLKEPDIAEKVLSEGLELKGWGGILSSIKMFGRVKDLGDRDIKEIYDYAYGYGSDGNIINFLFGFPEIITNSKGEKFYLGHYEKNIWGKGDKRAGSELPLNILYDRKRQIPANFVIGCIISPMNKPTIDFMRNSSFYGYSKPEEVQPLYDEVFKELTNEQIANPIYMEEFADLYARHGIKVEERLDYQQYQQYLKEKEKEKDH